MAKHSGVLRTENLNTLRRIMRKLGYYGNREETWHLMDTIDASRLVIDRLRSVWFVGEHEQIGWWVEEFSEPEEMSQAEQVIVYDRIVRPEAPAWPGEDK